MIMGLTRQTTKAHIVRAALEAIALQSNDIIELIRKECPNIEFNTLLVDGGASANDWLMQCKRIYLNYCITPTISGSHGPGGGSMCANHAKPTSM